MLLEKYTDIYKGLVIANDDPVNLGRVKVFVPHISMTLYEKWNKDTEDNKFWRYPGANLESLITAEIINRLKDALPWAEVINPIFGPSGSGYYNSESDKSTIEDSAFSEETPSVPPIPEQQFELTNATVSDTPLPGTSSTPLPSEVTNPNTTPSGGTTSGFGPPQTSQNYVTFYDATEAEVDSNTALGKTSTDSADTYGLRDGGSATGEFRYPSPTKMGIAAVDPSIIPYGSIIEVPTIFGTPYRFIAADTGSDVVNRTAAKINGSNSPVIDLFMQVSEWNKTIARGNQTVIIYPYTQPYTSLNQPDREELIENNTTEPSEFFEVFVHYNRNGSIRRASSSGNVQVNFQSNQINVIDSSGVNRLNLDLRDVPQSTYRNNLRDWLNNPKEVRTIGQYFTNSSPVATSNLPQTNYIPTLNTLYNALYSNLSLPISPESLENELITTPYVPDFFEVSVHYNRNGSIRSASKSGNVMVDLLSDQIIVRDSVTGEPRLGVNLNSIPQSQARNNARDWLRNPKEVRTLGGLLNSERTSTFNNNTPGLTTFDASRIPSTEALRLQDRMPNSFGGNDFAKTPSQITSPPNIAQTPTDLGTSTADSFRTQKNLGGNNALSPTRTLHEAPPKNGDKMTGENLQKVPNTNPNLLAVSNNKVKGIITTGPYPGNHVWVKFQNGDPLLPVIIGAVTSREDHLGNSDVSETK